jgi:hypothetical protein
MRIKMKKNNKGEGVFLTNLSMEITFKEELAYRVLDLSRRSLRVE